MQSDTNDGRHTVARILEVFAGKRPLSLLDELVSRDLVCYMDRVGLKAGRGGLGVWFTYVHDVVRQRQVSFDVDVRRLEATGPELYDVSGVVVTRDRKGESKTAPFALTYLVQEGRAMKVWSKRSNYVGVLGRSIELPLYAGFLFHFLRALYYDARRTAARRKAQRAGGAAV